MDDIARNVKQWINDGKDPRSAHWQGGLASMLNIFKPFLEPGKLTPVQALEDHELSVFVAALEVVDLSPGLTAAFLPPAIAGQVIPPESAEELQRIEKEKLSYKILIVRPGKEQRILCAEISEYAEKPGVDIFQSGALLGNYNFENQGDCLAQFKKIIRAHMWEKKNQWKQKDYVQYTVNWFEKVLDIRKPTVSVETDFSFFHSPTLIKTNAIDAIFTLIFEVILKRLNDSNGPYQDAVSAIRKIKYKEDRTIQYKEFAEQVMLHYLSVIKEMDLVDFENFSKKETRQFAQETDRTIQRIMNQMIS